MPAAHYPVSGSEKSSRKRRDYRTLCRLPARWNRLHRQPTVVRPHCRACIKYWNTSQRSLSLSCSVFGEYPTEYTVRPKTASIGTLTCMILLYVHAMAISQKGQQHQSHCEYKSYSLFKLQHLATGKPTHHIYLLYTRYTLMYVVSTTDHAFNPVSDNYSRSVLSTMRARTRDHSARIIEKMETPLLVIHWYILLYDVPGTF